MNEFCVSLAGRRIRISSAHDLAREYCINYRMESDSPVDFSVSAAPSDIEQTRRDMAEGDRLAGWPIRGFSEARLELIAIRTKIAHELLNYDTLLFHGSCVAMDGEGYLFIAKSGTGKSTHTRLWRECFPDRTFMVNGDMPLVRVPADGCAIVYGSPWNGKERLDTNTSVPLRAIAELHRGTSNRIFPIQGSEERLRTVLNSVYYPRDPQYRLKVISLVDRLLTKVRLYHLECTISREAVRTAYNGMRGSGGLPGRNGTES